MNALSNAIHGLILCTSNLVAIIVGFFIYLSLGFGNQIIIQAPIATLLTLIFFLMWAYFLRIFPAKILNFPTARDFSWIFIASLAWGPITFIPLHLATQGYITGIGNIIGLFMFQLPVNLIVLVMLRNIFR